MAKASPCSKGCRQCLEGRKLVIFVTGVCSRKCYFCPVGDHKFGKDVVFANERPVHELQDLFLEADACGAYGAGITGGDPLCRLDRTVEYIIALKKKYGKKFHIHLYTPLELVTEKTLQRLFDAGLDEIRFHFDFDDRKYWGNFRHALAFDWVVGVEVPAIPGKDEELRNVVDFVAGKVAFINLNELEVADNSLSKLLDQGFTTKEGLSYAVKGSEALAEEIVAYCQEKEVPAYYCSAQSKDKVQLMSRVKLRAQHVKQHFDRVTGDGTLVRGAIYEAKPSFGYREELATRDKETEIRRLRKLRSQVCQELRVNKADIAIDDVKYRLLCSEAIARRYTVQLLALDLFPAVVEEMPTYDLFEVEIDFLELE